MSSSREAGMPLRLCRALVSGAIGMLCVTLAHAQVATASGADKPASFTGIGRAATVAEVRAWDIDVRADLAGLPKGAGTVARGMQVWEGKCASCHGVFGESNEVFHPIVGGTTQDDIRTGRVANLADNAYPGRTTMMKLARVSTLWDYINRAMPWTQPKSLSVEEVYAVTAYILHLADVVPSDFTLSHENMAQVEQRLPNRHGLTVDHHLWPGTELGSGKARPDTKATACMKDCAVDVKVASYLPDHARDAHGNLAEQNRLVGAQRGADTSRPRGAPAAAAPQGPGVRQAAAAPASPGAAAAAATSGQAALALAREHACLACHGVDKRLVGPGFREISARYAGKADAVTYLSDKIRRGGQGVWGVVPMPAQSLPESAALQIARWLADGAQAPDLR